MSFPNFPNKHDGNSLFDPGDFVDYLKSLGRCPVTRRISGAIFCYDRRLMHHIRENHRGQSEETFFGKILHLEEMDEIAVIGDFGIGAPAAVAALEILTALGTKKFISIGTAGTVFRQH